ncbi:MAG: RNA-binding protein [Firmicutes bacterium]|nr:RNA-binding protein [Bacillota bacterium]
MTKTLYVGNLPYGCTQEDLESVFGSVAEVVSVRIVTDRQTGRSRGFAFVEVPADSMETVVATLHGAEIGGRQIVVNEARERTERPNRRY